MSQETWTAVDNYIADSLIPHDPVLAESLAANAASGLPPIDVAPNQGKLLHLLAKMQQARRILEIGTLGGYSTIWLARALPPEGQLVTLEAAAKHAEVAIANLARAGLSAIVDLRLGAALDSLALLHQEKNAPFDFIFIDADKPNNPAYLDWALRLSRVGTVIVVDNVVREGALVEADSKDESVRGSRRLFEKIAADPRLEGTAIQTVGIKGYDGFVLARVKAV